MDIELLKTIATSVSALAASASCFFAAQALKANNEAKRNEIESGRPYFILFEFGLTRPTVVAALSTKKEEVLDPTKARIEGTISNRGKRPASNVSGSVLILPIDAHYDVRVFPIGIADDAAGGTDWNVGTGALDLFPKDFPGRDAAPHYRNPGFFVVVGVQYEDPLTATPYAQSFFLRWPGISDGLVSGILVAANREERDRLIAQHSRLLQPFQP
ncbi:MAG TPA: hypothetical protein VGH81_07525 [Rudaea sp.]|jgi:hypothetical protein